MYTAKRETFGSVVEAWLGQESGEVRATTLAAYTTVTQSHILPVLGQITPGEMTGEHVRELMSEKARALAPSTVRTVAAVLRGALQFAEREGAVAPGCSSAVYAGKCEKRPDIRVMSRAEQQALESVLYGSEPSRTGVMLALYTGMRIGELCALRWRDVSMRERTITVSGSVQRIRRSAAAPGPRTELYFGPPKSANSARVIPIPAKVAVQMERIVSAPEHFVLSGSGRVVEPRTMQNRFKAYLREAGVKDFNFHALRHTFATRWMEHGFDVKALSSILGHADVSTTLNIYVHPSMDTMRDFIDQL